jgi:hypothetical protein
MIWRCRLVRARRRTLEARARGEKADEAAVLADILQRDERDGALKGNRNAVKHGRYTAEADANRRELAALLRSMRALASPCEND